jgi:hypothetical protein
MSAMKNLIENLRGIDLCLEDIKRTMNLDDVESPLGMHGTPSVQGVSALDPALRPIIQNLSDARAIAAQVDLHALANALDDGQLEEISGQIQVEYDELAEAIDCEKLARHIDVDSNLIEAIASHMGKSIDEETVAHYVDCHVIAAFVNVDRPDAKQIVSSMAHDGEFMNALAARVVVALMQDQLFIGVVTASATAGVKAVRPAATPQPAPRSDADPLTGIEYGTPA